MIKRLVSAVSHKFSKTRFQVTSSKLVVSLRTLLTEHATDIELISGNFSSTRQLVNKSRFRVTHNGKIGFAFVRG